MATTISEYPTQYLATIDDVLTQESFASKYGVQGAEFVGARQVKVPELVFTDSAVNDYDRFATENGVTRQYTTYTLDNDKQAVFFIDELDVEDAGMNATETIGRYERTVLTPAIDADFFAKAASAAKTKATTTLTADNIKDEIRKARSQFRLAGLAGGDLYMSSDAVAFLENAVDREFDGTENITDAVGTYDGFTVYEVDPTRMTADFIAISGGTNTLRYITKRATQYLFAPGTHQRGDGWLAQMRWVYGTIARKNKVAGIYTNTAASA